MQPALALNLAHHTHKTSLQSGLVPCASTADASNMDEQASPKLFPAELHAISLLRITYIMCAPATLVHHTQRVSPASSPVVADGTSLTTPRDTVHDDCTAAPFCSNRWMGNRPVARSPAWRRCVVLDVAPAMPVDARFPIVCFISMKRTVDLMLQYYQIPDPTPSVLCTLDM
jgi:hypothetical protein